MVRLIAFAALRLTTNSNLVGCPDRHVAGSLALQDARDVDAALAIAVVAARSHSSSGRRLQ